MRAVRVFVPIVGMLLGIVACSGNGDDGAGADVTATESEATTTTADATTTTTAAATETTTFAQADTPPPIVNTGEDFDAIVRSFGAYTEWLSVHPDPQRLADVFREGGPAWTELHPIFDDLATRGLRTNGDNPAQLSGIRLQQALSEDVVQIYLQVLNPPYQLLDSSGTIVEQRPGDPLTGWVFELRRIEGRWLIERRTVLGPV